MNYFGNNLFGGNYWADDLFNGAQTTPVPPVPPVPPTPQRTPLSDIISRRSKFSAPIKTPHNFITLFGGQPVPVLAFEPDPTSFRGKFYYNSRDNVLFKKMATSPFTVWKPVGNC